MTQTRRISYMLLLACSTVLLPYVLTADQQLTTRDDSWKAMREINQSADGLLAIDDFDPDHRDDDQTLYDRNKRRLDYEREQRLEYYRSRGGQAEQNYYERSHHPVQFYNYSGGYHGDPDVPLYPSPE